LGKKHSITEKVDFQRNRPFLVVELYYNPGFGMKTHQKDWQKKPDSWKINEYPFIKNRLTDKTLRQASVIIDIVNKKIIKSRFDANTTVDDIYKHYTTKYADEIQQAKNVSRLTETIKKVESNPYAGITVINA